MVKEFNYTSSKGTKLRKVFVIRENDIYLEGIDLTLLDEDSANKIVTIYKDFIPVKDKRIVKLENFNNDWNKAYRQFIKSKNKL